LDLHKGINHFTYSGLNLLNYCRPVSYFGDCLHHHHQTKGRSNSHLDFVWDCNSIVA